MSYAQLGTFDELMAGVDDTVVMITRRLRAIIFELHPAATEVVRLKDRAATYGLGPRKMIEGYCYLMPQRAHVNLGFYKGALLDDPEGLQEGSGALMRHVKLASIERAEKPAIRALILAAINERRATLKQG